MKKNGFTLVELLAVIAILAILIIFALPNFIKLFNNSKENSFIVEIKKIYDTAKQNWMKESILATSEITYARSNGVDCNNALKLSGRSEINYHIKLDKNGNVIEYYVEDGTYQYSYSGPDLLIENINNVLKIASINESDKVVITCDGAGGGYNDATPSIADYVKRQENGVITPGDEVIIDEEHFYVVSTNQTETVLLAKYDLNITNNQQVTSNQTKSKFASVGYWDESQCVLQSGSWNCGTNPTGLMSPYSDGGQVYCESMNGKNCAYIFDGNSTIYDAVNAYANKIATDTGYNITGRLMTLAEATALKSATTEGSKIIKDKNGHKYWLGTAYGKRFIWYVDSSGVINGDYFSNSFSVRPVIIVSTSLVGGNPYTNNGSNNDSGNTLTGTNIATFVERQVEGNITIGDELTIAEENFYIIDSNLEQTILLAKYDLNVSQNAQVTSGQTTITFANEGYWDGLQCVYKNGGWSCLGSPEGLLSQYATNGKVYCEDSSLTNCAYVYDGNSNLITAVNEYASKIESSTNTHVTGRLLTLEEAVGVSNQNQAGLNAIKDKNGIRYWLATAYGKRFIWNIDSSGKITGNYFNNKYGIRPVIIVSTSAL